MVTPLTPQGRIDSGTNTGVSSVRLAVPEFRANSTNPKAVQLTQLFNQVLWDDLEYSGNLVLASRSFYPAGNFVNPGDIKTADWITPGINAEFIAFGSANLVGTRFSVDARLWDLKLEQNREMIGTRYNADDDTDASARLIAHRFADEILEKVGFGKGIARTKITYVSDQGATKEIYAMDYDGSNSYAITSLKNIAITPSFAPDGEKIAFTKYRRDGTDIAIISRIDRHTFPFPQQPGTNTTPAWSPDGSSIAYSSRRDGNDMEIYVADWNGKNIRRLTVSPSIDISPTWNPKTGKQLAFVSGRSGTPQIYTIDAEGTNVERLIMGGGDAENPAWSPDGLTIAFAWQPSGSSHFDIYIHDMTTGRNSQLTQNAGDNERPTWAPDGKHLAFESSRSGRLQIYSMLADGSKVRQLTSSGTNKGPSWSGYIQQ